jgi:hypothetical protein
MVSCIGAWDGLPRYRSGIRIANPAFARSMCHWESGMTASIRVFMHQRACTQVPGTQSAGSLSWRRACSRRCTGHHTLATALRLLANYYDRRIRVALA